MAKKFIEYGASISICGMNEDKLLETKKTLNSTKHNNQEIFAHNCDISNEKEVIEFINSSIEYLGKIDCLINNAAIYGPKGLTETIQSEDFVKTFENNFFSVFYTSKAIIPHFKENGGGKIINISGGGEKPFPRFAAYATSKNAVVKLSEILAAEVFDFNIAINCVAPGAMNTALLNEVLNTPIELVGKEFYNKCLQQKKDGGKDPAITAELCAFLISQCGMNVTGRLISAVWDNWQNLVNEKLESDIYTMRRITK
jgi:NAD(P)-dependent dehydrogenase (short-subunit alcohol dehydrogenase family)